MSDEHWAEQRVARARASALARAPRGHVYEGVEEETPLTALLAAEAEAAGGTDLWEVRAEALQALLGWLWGDGNHPARVVRRAYAMAKKMAPDLVEGMNQTELALMLGETRAAYSARMIRLFGRGGNDGRKNPAACARFAAAAEKNRSRRDGELMRRARTKRSQEDENE